jgi:tetratricopeptide (TPR) repeat protein
MVAGCLLLVMPVVCAQSKTKSAASSADAVRAGLVAKAHALESRGRPDMAVQLWQQILLSTPNNTEALAGLARDYKLMGSSDLSNQTLDRLRRVNPRDSNIAKIQAMPSTVASSSQLRQAGELSKQGRNDEAMRIYRQLYGNNPPQGDIALGYYQTLYGTNGGKQAAIDGLRNLASRNPGDARYAIQLGIMLTYEQRTRSEGIRLLWTHQNDPEAQAPLRQALMWDSANPSSAAELREYLKNHPKDTEVETHLKQNEAKLAQMNSGIARTAEERAAFAALNGHRLDEAEKRFTELLAKDPDNGRVAAGMGFLRMQQKNFGGAIGYLTQAEQKGYKAKSVEDALASSRFWFTMDEASRAVEQNQFNVAAIKYRAALDMNPRSADALNGLAGLYVKQQQYTAAATVYDQLLRIQPGSSAGWRGLFLAYANDKQNAKALAISARFPSSVKAALNRDPEYLHALAGIYLAQGRNAEAQHVLSVALSLPFPDKGGNLLIGTKLQYAGILMEAKHYEQALALYSQVLAASPDNVSGWIGYIDAQHELGQDERAIDSVGKMPAATYEAALSDPGFLAMLGAVYQQANQYDVAQGFLERAEKLQIAAGGQPSVALQLQLAGIYLLRNNTDQAYAIYRQVITDHPDRADAWKGMISTLAATKRNQQALQEIAQIPAPTRKLLEDDIEFLQTEASLYAVSGDTAHAIDYLNRVDAYYAKSKTLPPPNIAIQRAWLLYNTGSDRALYVALMHLGGRSDLTVAQRETVQEIWANWSVHRAAAAMENNDVPRAVDILDAASQAFPNNLAVRKAVAGGFARVGRAKEAVALFKTVPMQDSSAGDFEGAVSAALAANDRNQAELWLRQAMERFPNDPGILTLAARYEQARGDSERAADYYRASLAVMPKVTPVDRLAHALVYPEQSKKAHRAVTAADLQRLLDPQNEPFAKTTRLPSLPAYGSDPYYGNAPVILPQSQPAQSASPSNPSGVSQQMPVQAPNIALHLRRQAASSTYSILASWTRTPRQIRSHRVFFAAWNPSPRRARLMRAAWMPVRPAVRVKANLLRSVHLHAVAQSASGQPEIVPNPPHSMASDAWKGLVFSLMSGNRNAEAIDELGKIPPEVRRQLEVDIEWVQGIASLYFSAGDTTRATVYLNRVENYYLVHRTSAPASLEVQHAWLLYNLHDDVALYPLLQRLDVRSDLTADQHKQVEDLWGDWAVRRATEAIESGHLLRGVQILQAASLDYPGSSSIRLAVAGAYARVGRSQEALTLFKTIPLNEASAGDFQGAISAAISAGDLAQAEAWLRIALSRYPNDPLVLSLAARFEQARGNNERASAFWRAALSAMPAGSSIKGLDYGLVTPSGSYNAPGPGETKHLLDPRFDPLPTADKLAPLPSYKRQAPAASLPVAAPAPSQTVPITAPSNNPLPIPSRSQGPVYTPSGATGKVIAAPLFYSRKTGHNASFSGPVLIQQSAILQSVADGAQEAGATSQTPLRITSQPMNAQAALSLALFAEQTDSQLTQGSATLIHNVPNASAMATQAPARQGVYNLAQYTPSPQDIVTGAYSTPQQQQSAAQQQETAVTPAKPKASNEQLTLSSTKHKKSKKARRHADYESEPTLGSAPIRGNALPAESAPAPQQTAALPDEPAPQSSSDSGLTDEELEQRNLPPLRGPWIRTQRRPHALSPREEAETQLQAIESSYSGWLGGAALLSYRTGDPGYSQLADVEAPFEVSAPLGYHARITAVARPVFLDSGQANGNATISVTQSTTTGSKLVSIAEPIGTLANTSTTIPAQQNASGLGGELQLAFPHFAIAGGYTPANFLIATITGRFSWTPAGGPFTFNFVRDSIKDSQLSYSGLRDPKGDTLGTLGQIWGGVVYNQGQIQIKHGNAESGYYFAASGQYINGYHVLDNRRFDGNGGAYWRAYAAPEFGNLNVGANFFAMHYTNNQNAFTHGMGGYFSPQVYFMANMPITWQGHYEDRWHYNIMGALGVQAFQEDSTSLWPLVADKALETSQNNPMLPNVTSISGNYDLRSQVAYQINPHWFAGGYFSANNSRDFSNVSVGFFVRYMFRSQPSNVDSPTGLFSSDGMRTFSVP